MKTRRPGPSSSKPASRPKGKPVGKAPLREGVHVAGAMKAPQGPFSRMVEVAQAEDKPLRLTIKATEAEADEIAWLNQIPAIVNLLASFEVTAAGRERFQVRGEVKARVTQVCVVSLEPFERDVVQPVDVIFATLAEVERAEAAYARRHEEDPDAENIPEPPDPIINGQIDLGALACEELTLGLDPYPRKEGVEFVPETTEADDIVEVSPFAALAKLKQGREEN
jgi:uncharacterized metal-binding protein YceD (DUF177 family)